MKKIGKVYLIGAGCGDYDLITLRGMHIIKNCDTVIYDSLIDNRLLDFVPVNSEKICVGKRAGHHSESQDNINKLLIKKALDGKTVVRLKGGDPFVFGRGVEEIMALREHDIEYSVIPGISSSIAVPELAGIPVTHRDISRSFHVITGHTAENIFPENLSLIAKLDGTLVVLMGLGNLDRIAQVLINSGKPSDTPTAVISDGASKSQRIVRGTLENISSIAKRQGLKAPAVIVVGETAGFDFSQTLKMPLENISVTVTGTKSFTSKISARLENIGADVKTLESLMIFEYPENPDFENALRSIAGYDWLVLTSINGAEIFFNRLMKLKIDIRNLAHLKFAVIGKGTAEVLRNHGIIPSLIPEKYTSESLAKCLCRELSDGEIVLILRAEQGSDILTKILDGNNISYSDIKTYDVLSEEADEQSSEINTDFLTFASSSGVDAFFTNDHKLSPQTKIICIGDVTASALKKYGLRNFQISETQDIDGIVDTILREVKNEKIQTS